MRAEPLVGSGGGQLIVARATHSAAHVALLLAERLNNSALVSSCGRFERAAGSMRRRRQRRRRRRRRRWRRRAAACGRAAATRRPTSSESRRCLARRRAKKRANGRRSVGTSARPPARSLAKTALIKLAREQTKRKNDHRNARATKFACIATLFV